MPTAPPGDQVGVGEALVALGRLVGVDLVVVLDPAVGRGARRRVRRAPGVARQRLLLEELERPVDRLDLARGGQLLDRRALPVLQVLADRALEVLEDLEDRPGDAGPGHHHRPVGLPGRRREGPGVGGGGLAAAAVPGEDHHHDHHDHRGGGDRADHDQQQPYAASPAPPAATAPPRAAAVPNDPCRACSSIPRSAPSPCVTAGTRVGRGRGGRRVPRRPGRERRGPPRGSAVRPVRPARSAGLPVSRSAAQRVTCRTRR